ncbi:MAG: DMT family transporter [Novosphingobium sp.]
MPQRPTYALFLRLGAALSFGTMAMLIKYAGDLGISLPQIMVWRQAVPIPVLLAFLWFTGGLGKLRTRRMGSHALRSVIDMVGMVCNFGSVLLLPLAEATTLGFTAPFFAVLIGTLILREHVGIWRWTAVLLGFAGVLIVAQPGGHPVALLGVLAGLGAGLTVAVVSFLIRDLAKSEDSIAIVFYFSVFGALIAAATLPLVPFVMPGPKEMALLACMGLAGTLGQLLMTASLRHGAVVSVIVLDYTSLIWATIYGWLIWDLLPPFATWIGAPLIIGAGVLIAWREHRLGKEKPIDLARS